MFFPPDMNEEQAKEWANNSDWKPMPINETREEYDLRLKDKPKKMRDYHWSYYKWVEQMSNLTAEERFNAWKEFQDTIL